MTAKASTPVSGHLDVGDTWLLGIDVRDDKTKKPTDATVVVTVTKPDATTSLPAVTRDDVGCYSAGHVVQAAGRYTATAEVSGAVVSVVTFAVTAEAVGVLPDLVAVKAYLDVASLGVAAPTDAQVADALATETAAQAKACEIGAVYPADLAEALKRRVARNLAMRGIPLGLATASSEAAVAVTRVGDDPEVKRLEGPYRMPGIA